MATLSQVMDAMAANQERGAKLLGKDKSN